MAEFQEVMRQAARMCGAHEECEECPVCKIADMVPNGCLFGSGVDAGYIEEKIMGWAKKHPEPSYPTWMQWWKNTFPDASDAFPPCKGYFMDLGDRRKTCRISCEECKKQPIPADIAEKLGIKPVGGE